MALSEQVLVIGGSAYDITGKIAADTVVRDSNPGRVFGSCGGVGRNIAENMARMGLKTSLMTVLGTDAFSRELAASCADAGIEYGHSVIKTGQGASVYLSILDRNGDLELAASDLTLFEDTKPEAFLAQKEYISSFPYVFVEGNATPDQLACFAECCSGKLFADAVSVKKAVRLREILPKLYLLKVNRTELRALTGLCTNRTEDVRKATDALLRTGVRRVFVTLGTEGSCCADEIGFFSVPSFPAEVVNVTGAGDAFAAAVVYGCCRGYDSRDILLLGTAAARLTLQNPGAVCREMTENTLLQCFEMLKSRLL